MDVCRYAVSAGETCGADEVEAVWTRNITTTVEAECGEISTASKMWNEGLRIRVVQNAALGSVVTYRMDRDAIVWGADHREIDFFHSEKGIREWLRGFSHLAYQETLTDYLRVAMGHLVLDDIGSRYDYMDEFRLMKAAYRSFTHRGFHRKYFRE